jgi:hypothetical protein
MARFHVVEVVVQNSNAARSPTRAVHVKYLQHVDRTSHVAEVFLDAATDAHPSVASVRYDDNFVGVALDSQVFRLAQGLFDCCRSFELCSTNDDAHFYLIKYCQIKF